MAILFGKGKRAKAPRCSAVIAAAGLSSRMEGVDKQFKELAGVPALAHTLMAFEGCECISEIIVVAREDGLQRVSEICGEYNIGKAKAVIAGGETRLESVLKGVFAASKNAKLIAVHDGARPCVTGDIIERTVLLAARVNAAAPAVSVVSTLKRIDNGVVAETLDRENLYEIQTPQVFMADLIKAALTNVRNKSIPITDDCMAVELLGIKVHISEGSRVNIKLTDAGDFALAEAIMLRRSL